MRIVSLVSYPFLPAKAGGQRAVALGTKYLARHAQLTCVGVTSNDASLAEGYELKNVLSDSPLRYMNVFYFFTLRRILEETRADLLWIEHPYYGWLALLLKWFTGVPLAVRSHNIEGIRFRTLGKWWWRLLWQYERFTHRQARFSFFMQEQDRQYAINNFGLKPERCLTLPYGIEWQQPPAQAERSAASKQLRAMHAIGDDEVVLLFNGAFEYAPNLNALKRILDSIDPLLQKQAAFKYRIIICGRGIPSGIINKKPAHIIMPGFVDDISLYFKGAAIFINPVIEGGGIKTKLVEALGYNLTSVSTASGATGIDPSICNSKLLLSADNDWQAFVSNIIAATRIQSTIPSAYFEYFYWDNSVKKVVATVRRLV
jgi:polysaccharide biosynthesis protein PslH